MNVTNLIRGFNLLAACWALLLGLGCGGTPPEAPPVDPGRPIDARDYRRFSPGDEITIILSDFPNGPVKYPLKVTEAGTVVLHLNQTFKVAGKTPVEVQEEIHRRYVPDYYPRMTVQVNAEGLYFFVRGRVEQDGRYPYTSGMTVLKAVATAGGFDPFAKKRDVQVTRLNGKKYRVDCEKAKDDSRYDLEIFPGDTIFVPRRRY